MTAGLATCAALVLAAGWATRFGSDKRVAALPSGQTLLAETLRQALEHFDEVLVVVRPGDEPQRLGIGPDAKLVYAAHAENGLSASLAAGIQALQASRAQAVAIMLGDMPWVTAHTLRRLRAEASETHIVMPFHQDERGHPVLFGRAFWPALECVQGDQGGRQVILDNRHAWRRVDVEDSGVLRDVDTPTDLLG
ncbi:NTP transferase domain-containing protein [Pseudomonas sp. SWI6]|uniref:nucleotidyltransferase family protein n=1 Tax=Pseudomonas sp. SWI6 TaxID=2083051 RepID=UPI0021154742|nr:nucleotidyltransferase family protein [Pseudomonas sp. SWI6]